jgi:hypothetical protein
VTHDLRVYAARDGSAKIAPPVLIGNTAAGAPWSSSSLRWARESGGDGWAIFTARVAVPAPVASSLDDSRAQVDFTDLGTPDRIVRIYGTKSVLP